MIATTANTATATETEIWEAWLDGKRDQSVEFTVPAGGAMDIAAEGARALGVELSEEINVKIVSTNY